MTDHKYAKNISCLLLFVVAALVPALSYAAVTTDFSSYSAPANVLFSGMNGSNGAVLYLNEGTGPVCPNTGAVPSSASNSSLSDWCVAQPGYTYSSSTTGTYQLLQPTTANCTGSYASCIAANPGMPGAYEADFTITGSTPTSTPASSTVYYVENPDQNLAYAVFMFFMSMFGIIWLMRKH